MNVLVVGGDLRYLEIINSLSCNHIVDVIGYKNTYINNCVKNVCIDNVDISKYDVIIFPINGVMEKNLISCRFNNNPIKISDDFLVNSKDDVLIFSGISTPNLNNILEISNRKCTYLMNDKSVITKNSIPTVEGIIADIIIKTEKAINDSSVLVFGYGNIGSVLVSYLKMLGADVTVSVIKKSDMDLLTSDGIKCFYSFNHDDLINAIKGTDIIINTVPKTIINDCDIKYINSEAYVLDISSHPHGINQEVLDEFFIKNSLYLGIPGKVAPKTSGKILTKKINEVMGDI